MHILLVSDGDDRYGASQSMKQLIIGLLKYYEDIEISVILPSRINLDKYYKQLGCHTYKILYEPFYQGLSNQKWKIPIKFLIRGIEYLIGKWTAVFFLTKKLDMKSIDIIHSNSSREDLGAALALKYNKPLIWHIREFGYECFSYRKNYIELMNAAASEFIAVSDAVKMYWTRKGLNGEKIVRIYNGVSTEVDAKKVYKKDRNDSIKLIMLGYIGEAKGQYQIIKALGLMKKEDREKVTLDIVGSGTKAYIKKLKKMIEKYELAPSVKFLGYQENFSLRMKEYDCGIMCSKTEGFGRVTIEYMMAGLPVIASDIEANRELVIDNENGFLYSWNNPLELKDKVAYLLRNIEKLEVMGSNARAYAQTYFSSKLYVDQIYKEYLKFLEEDKYNEGNYGE